MGKNGGARPGAGRKKGSVATHTLQAQEMRKLLIDKLRINFGPIVDKALEQARNGDKAAREWLTDHGLGKAIQGIELSNKDGEPFLVADEQYKQALIAANKKRDSD